jgi:hypothetical protein
LRALRFLGEPDNIGNIVFLDAINRLLPGMHNVATIDFVRDHKQYKGYKVVLALANFLSSTWQAPNNLLDILEKHSFVLFSVGLQCELECEYELKLSSDARKLIELAGIKGSVVGVRGWNTKNLLENLKIECQVIGCPSVHIAGHWLNSIKSEKLRICFTNTMLGNHREVAKQVNRLALLHGSGYIYQTEVGLIADYLNLPIEVTEFIAQQSWNLQHAKLLRNRYFDCGYYNLESDKWNDLKNWFHMHGHFFTQCKPWREYARQFEYCVGTRFHSGVVALQSGSRPIFINIDIRVQEMTEFHRLPVIPLNTLHQIESLNQLIEKFDMSEYNSQFDQNFKQLREFCALHFI